jgi:hypothetical protein
MSVTERSGRAARNKVGKLTSEPVIAQVLNRDFVVDQMQRLLDDLSGNESLEPVQAFGIDSSEQATVAETRDALEHALERERTTSSGQSGYDEPKGNFARRGALAPLDDFAFMSRDPVVNLVQSALDEHLQDSISTVEPPLSDRRAAVAELGVTDRRVPDLDVQVDTATGRRLFGRFQPLDARWVNSAIAMAIRIARKRHPFNPHAAAPVKIADNARIVLVGDWGTGVPRARAVAQQMRAVIDQGLAAGREQHVVHLGDVYYSGWPREYDRRFLALWPVRPAEAGTITSWSLNANHDMYSGGFGYFDHLLNDVRFARQQKSSFFSLTNDHWNVLGVDTGWKEGDLQDPQASWVHDLTHAAPPRKTMLLSHHQPFSSYDDVGSTLTDRLRSSLDDGTITSWFWGHEHRCMLFAPHAGVRFGRCIGHGGVPVYMRHAANAPVPTPGVYEFRDSFFEGVDAQLGLAWARFGFAVLDFDGPNVHVRYIDENGTEHLQEDIA